MQGAARAVDTPMNRSSSLQAVLPSARPWPLHDTLATRQIEARAMAAEEPHRLMERAGQAVARLALAVRPGGRSAWIAAGPGNNGGDGLVAARHLHAAGWAVTVSLLAEPTRLPADAAWALQLAQDSGICIQQGLTEGEPCDIAIDALLGLGSRRAPEGALAAAVQRFNRSR